MTTTPPMSSLTREEIKAILDSCRTDSSEATQRDLLFFTLPYNTGARSEAIALKASDVNGGIVHVCMEKRRKDRLVPSSPL